MLVEGEEVFFVDYGTDRSKTLLYAPLRSYLGLLRKSAMDDFLKEGSRTRRVVLERLKAKPLIDPKRILKDAQSRNPELALALTDNCNLGCKYCHASAGDPHKTKSMSVAMVDAIIDKYFQHIRKEGDDSIRISFSGGGEPTFRFSLLKHAVERCKNHAAARGMRCWFSMATNGCFGNTVRRYIVENFANISLSFDGPAHIQDRHRPHKEGSGSFEAVFETAKYFHRNNFPFAVRVTVSEFSMHYLEEIIDFFSSELPGILIGLEPLLPMGRARKDIDLKAPDDHQFAKRLIEILDYAEGKNAIVSSSGSVDYDFVRSVFCTSVAAPNWTVKTDGTVAACTRDDAPEIFEYGFYDQAQDELVFDADAINKIRDLNVFNYEECRDCFAKYHCAGDCPDRRLSNRVSCDAIRQVGRHVLNQRINA
jgi:uncharacterized protein